MNKTTNYHGCPCLSQVLSMSDSKPINDWYRKHNKVDHGLIAQPRITISEDGPVVLNIVMFPTKKFKAIRGYIHRTLSAHKVRKPKPKSVDGKREL